MAASLRLFLSKATQCAQPQSPLAISGPRYHEVLLHSPRVLPASQSQPCLAIRATYFSIVEPLGAQVAWYLSSLLSPSYFCQIYPRRPATVRLLDPPYFNKFRICEVEARDLILNPNYGQHEMVVLASCTYLLPDAAWAGYFSGKKAHIGSTQMA